MLVYNGIYSYVTILTRVFILLDPSVAKTEHSRCEPVGGRGCQCKDDTWKYEFVTRCELHRWDKGKLCTVMQNRLILFVGDSVVQQTFSAFKSKVLGGHVMRECEDSLSFEHSDTLINKQFHGLNRGTPIGDILAASKSTATHQHKAVTVFVSAGAHIDSLINAVDVMNQTMNACVVTGVDCVWLPQLPNHNNCANITHPFRSYLEVLQHSYTCENSVDDPYHHVYYEHFFHVALDMFETKLVDTWHALALRGYSIYICI